jgi:aldose sugar dehydrogenase
MTRVYVMLALILISVIAQGGYSNDLSKASATPLLSNTTGIIINDPKLRADVVFQGFKFPTSMAFLGPNDILVLEKNEGTVWRIINGTKSPEALLQVNVSGQAERGMLGIAVAKNETRNVTYVFLYYTETASKDGKGVTAAKEPLGNRLYRYELVNDKLINPKLLLDLPATPGPAHNGGKIVIGPDNYVYLVIGDVNSVFRNNETTQSENLKHGLPADGRGGILKVNQDGKVIPGHGILGDTFPLNIYYAYGIRNSFGIGFDPITGKLWDTENGDLFGDEINLVEPGFNSGWSKVQGLWKGDKRHSEDIILYPNDLLDFGGKGKYQTPKFVWNKTVGPTALAFLNSAKLGLKYENDMFVGDFGRGVVYDFSLNHRRNELSLDGPLADKIANTTKELKGIIFGEGFGGITDIKTGPDGYLYILSLHDPAWHSADCDRRKLNNQNNCISFSTSPVQGTIFRINPITTRDFP